MRHDRARADGSAEESRALRYLVAHGLQPETRNYRSRFGEIDLIMRDGETTVFVEVRSRRGRRHGGAAASISVGKQKRIAKTALAYLKERYGDCDLPMRFDVVAIDGQERDLKWLRSAFEF